jgi:hypothetical protein
MFSHRGLDRKRLYINLIGAYWCVQVAKDRLWVAADPDFP